VMGRKRVENHHALCGPGYGVRDMVRPPGIEPDRVRQGGKACKLNDPRQSKRTPRPNGRPHEKAPGQ